VVNPDGTSEDVNQPLPLPLGVSDLAVGSEPELMWLIAWLAAIAIFLVMRQRWGDARQFGWNIISK